MKKTFFILYFLLLSVVSFGNIVDSLPIKQNLGSSSTLVEVPAFGALRAGIAFRSFTDTTEANTTFLDDYPFMVISTTSDGNLWMRNAGGTAWTQLGGGSISPTGNFWALGGNTIYSQFIPRVWGIGSLTQDSIGIMTNGQFRLKFYADGIEYSNNSTDSLIGINLSGYAVKIPKSGGSVTTIYTGDGTLNEDRSIDGDQHNFSISNTATASILSTNGNITTAYAGNGNNARIEASNSATGRLSTIFAHSDSVAIWPSLGVVSIDTLAAWAGGDTTSHKPTTWNIHTKRFEVSPSWFGGNGGSVTTLSGNARYAIKFNGIDGSNVWLGQFYPVADSLYQCYYEWWVRVDSSGYIWSDGYGGSHDLLFGFVGNDTACSITGNMFYAFTGQSFGSWDLMKRGTVHHVAVSFTGTYIIVWIDGVPTQRSARTLPRLNVASSGCGGGYFGGSDHQNADCNVFQMRAYEFGLPFYIGDGDCFHPNQSFTSADNNVVLCINVDKTNNLLVNDLSTGFWGIKHDGFRNYNVGGDPAYPPSQTNYLNYPEIVVDSIVQATYTGSTSSSAAKIYDYFERADQVPAFQVAPSLDSTQGGSLGKKKWEDGTYANSATLFAGIINKYAYFSATTLQNYKKVLGNSNTQDVRVTFANTTTEVNVDVLARVQDDNNKILGRVSNGGQTLTLYSWIGGVFTTIGSYTGTAISEVKLVVSGTTATLYGDGVSRVSGSVAGIPSSNYSGFGCNSAYSRVKKFEVY